MIYFILIIVHIYIALNLINALSTVHIITPADLCNLNFPSLFPQGNIQPSSRLAHQATHSDIQSRLKPGTHLPLGRERHMCVNILPKDIISNDAAM